MDDACGADLCVGAQVYWLPLDYLSVARAALRCSAPFTAMLYVEYWCKAEYGRLKLEDVDLLKQVDARAKICPLRSLSPVALLMCNHGDQ